MCRNLALLVLLLVSPAWAQEKAKIEAVQFPVQVAPVSGVVKLSGDGMYVIVTEQKCIVVSSPEGIVTIVSEVGPIKTRAKFPGSRGYETKTFGDKDHTVWFVEAAATGRCEVIAVTQDGKVFRRLVECNLGPQPPPGPPVPVPPDPGPNPPKADKLALVVVWESADSTPTIAGVMKDLAFWNGLKAQGHVFFQIDKDQKDKDGSLIIDSHKYRPYVDAKGLPVLIVMGTDGLVFESLRLPDTKEAIQSLVKKWSGK